ncbi:eukaryotic translation initiation factor 4E transporter [Drosophila obscura]|uniref:eukaryotic translation initiation factor 4E transporter n=1 Tax=Drosophila obscura TaxID=7282 RepID=UPI000BA1624E|nr:eukaryotic translation initiation factor 4E transporter [Drosophila obscura]
MDLTKDQARYSRADLLALRYEGSSRQRPQCVNRNELQTLNFWKVNASANVPSNYANPNKISLSPETDNSSLSSTNNGLISSRRAMRNRERANNYYQRFAPSDSHSMCIEDKDKDTQSTQSVLGGPSFKSSIIDHRSISSSHLMPAFAKRRFAAVNCGNGTENNDPMNTNSDDISVGENMTVGLDHASTPTHSQGKGMSSPSRKGSEWVGESCERRSNNVQQDHDQSLASSPTFSTTRQERRIGSGRLLPRSDNWDYKGQQQASSGIEKEKERSQNGSGSINQQNPIQNQNQNQQRPRTFSGRHSDRLTENIGDRRFQYDNKRSVDRQGMSSRRSSNKDSGGIQGRGKRTNMYHQHDRHEEPEWFSAGPTSQLETIDLHGFDDHEHNDERSELEEKANRFPSKQSQAAERPVVDGASRSSSISSLNVIERKTKDDVKDTGESVPTFIQPPLETTKQNKNHQQSGRLPCTSNSEGEFNFDAFLNMHPLDPTLMSNDGDDQDETKGTSRFSRWFRPKEAANNNEPSALRELGAQETHDIPSVKDLEAQMTKVDLRSDYTNPMAVAYGGQQAQVEKPVARDTEAFRKLLQQLGSQSSQHQMENEVYHMINASSSAIQNTLRPHSMDPQQNILRDHSPQMKEDNMESFQQRFKHNDCMPKRMNEPMVQQQHPQLQQQQHQIQGVNTPNILLAQKRMEVHHLIQSIARGDVSVEFLEKELSNPSTVTHTKDVIATVLREFSNSRRNSLAYKPAYPIDMDHHSLANLSFHQAHPQHQNYPEDLFPQNSSNHGISQNIRHSNSPTPLAFTPTSVLRKMTADKETPYNQAHQQYQMHPQNTNTKLLGPNPIGNEPQAMSAQPRMILGGGNYSISPNSPQMSPKLPQSRNQQPIKWAHGPVQMAQGKSFGRPILKGSLNTVPHQPTPVPFVSKAELQQHQNQQRFKPMQPTDSVLNTENMNQNIPYSDGISQMQHHHYLQLQQQSHQQLRHRVIHGAQISSSIPGGVDISESGSVIKSNYHRDDRLSSPTNNQLAQWFSPELLARASAGKLPLLNMNQTLSLEEFERSIQHSSAVVHN